jgi:arsenite methyltransferase
MDATSVTTAIHDKYSSIALASSKPTTKSSCCAPKPQITSKPSCCSSNKAPTAPCNTQANGTLNEDKSNGDPSLDYATRVAQSFGYDASALSSLPPSTNLGLSCGNPLATQNLAAHEVVIDLGSGAGLDVILAAKQIMKAAENVKLTGKVYGIDSSEAMIELARKNTLKANLRKRDADSDGELVEYVHAPITKIPLAEETADLVISNCVINLVPHEEKHVVFKEIHRLLKPGGRVAVSDILTKKQLPQAMRENVALVVGCVSGAASVEEYRKWLLEAGFKGSGVVFRGTGTDLNAYKLTEQERKVIGGDDSVGCCGVAVPKTQVSTGSGYCSKGEQKMGTSCGGDANTAAQLFDDSVFDIDFNEWVGSYETYAIKA